MPPANEAGQPAAGAPARRAHAVLDLPSRRAKALKIQLLLGLGADPGPLRLLEVGTGSGGIAAYFASQCALECQVEAVDVADHRTTRAGYRFTRVEDERLPFPDASFDVVISNHVLEHVGGEAAQRRHLGELRRVLQPRGLGYLALPNRWQWVEPHYRLPGLSWLPERWRSTYLRLSGRGTHYDCRPLSLAQTEALLRASRFSAEQQHGEALRLTYALERPDAPAYRLLLGRLPDAFYARLRALFPTLIFVLRPLP